MREVYMFLNSICFASEIFGEKKKTQKKVQVLIWRKCFFLLLWDEIHFIVCQQCCRHRFVVNLIAYRIIKLWLCWPWAGDIKWTPCTSPKLAMIYSLLGIDRLQHYLYICKECFKGHGNLDEYHINSVLLDICFIIVV